MNPRLTIHRSNRLEELAGRLCDQVAAPLPDPLRAETIIVQSLGMRRWLALTLATRLGISMNCRFPFPHTLAHEVFRSAFPDVEESSAFSREVLPWRIHALLPQFAAKPEFASLRRYVGADELSGLKQFQLARQVAGLFDRLLVHRAGELLQWQRGKGADWPVMLWRALVDGHEGDHPPALLERLLARIQAGQTGLPGIPPRLSIFGISSLPPYYIELLNAVAQCVELHLFLFEPTDQYWGDIQAPKEQRRFLRRHAKPDQTAADLHLETGNALLASLGKPGRQFANAVQDLEPDDFDEVFVPPGRTSLLSQLQADLFELCDREHGERETIEKGDRSIQIHSCHGPMREVEILNDHLLDLFRQYPTLTPKDIVVMMPDVETYAPFIEAVFDAPEDERLRIPFTIADRKAASENAPAQNFLELLALHGSRFGAETVLRVLEREAVRKRFGLVEDDLETIRGWVENTRIRWGIDGGHRGEFGAPPFAQNSWRAGLDRLLLGYALTGDGLQVFEDILPAEGIEGGQAEVLGKFADFTAKLFALIPALGRARNLAEWESALGEVLTTFFDESDESLDKMRRIRAVLEMLGEYSKFHHEPLPFEVIQAHLTQAFADTDSGRGFLVGHVTFCSLKPMRSIPFRVICMLGLNDTAFPRRDPEGALDLLAGAGQPGRSRRDEDRQVFLEAILSARDVFYLSYSGLSTKDNSKSPPSVIVSELLDYLSANYEIPGGPLAEWVRIEHRLQPFSSSYFSGQDDRLFSYSEENARAAQLAALQTSPDIGLTADMLPEPGPEWLEVELAKLQKFFRHPARFFLADRLKVRLPGDEIQLDETEPLSVNSLDGWKLQSTLAERLLTGAELAPIREAIRADGILPFGSAGDRRLHEATRAVEPLVRRVAEAIDGDAQPSTPVSLDIGKWHLSGVLSGRSREGVVRLTPWTLSAKDRMSAWLEHLLRCATQPEDQIHPARLFATDLTLEIRAAPEAARLLEELLAIYWEGLRAPAPFFPKCSFEVARRILRPKSKREDSPEKMARDVWMDSESKDPCNELCFRGRDPLDERWVSLAVRIWKPFFDHSTETGVTP